MDEPSALTKRLHGPEVHVYKAGRLYLKDFFLSPKRPCSVTLKGRTFTVSEAARDVQSVYSLKNATLMVQRPTKKIVIGLENGEKLVLFAADEDDLQDWMTELADSIHWKIQRYYELGETLGQGAFATVAKGRCKLRGEMVAIKIIDKTTCSLEDFKYLQREIDISQKLHHSNVVQTIDLFESEKRVFIVLEYIGGGTLQTFRQQHGSITESEARRIMRDIFAGVEYVHNRRVAHRDIKPENMLCTSTNFPMTVKLMDFGLARNLDENVEKAEDRYDFDDTVGPDGLMSTPVGTPKFVAPELLTGNPYGKEIDIFACGVVMYWLLCGYMPFDHPDTERLIAMIKRTEFGFPNEDWGCISKEAKELISGLLSRNPSGRPTATEALQYAWFEVAEEVQSESESIDLSKEERGLDQPSVVPKHSGSGSDLYHLSRSSEIDNVDDISDVIRMTSGARKSRTSSEM